MWFSSQIYDLDGKFDINNALEDIKYFGKDGELIRSKAKTASDVWIEYDKKKYKDDEIFKSLIEDIQNYRK